MSRQDRKRQLYFWKQRALGVLLLILTGLTIWIMDGDATIALITIPIGLIMIFSKDGIVMDDYYNELEDKLL